MIRALLIATIAVLSSVAAAQVEAPLAGRLEIVGEAPSACIIRSPGAATGANMTFQSTGTSSGEIRVVQMVDPNTAEARAATVNLALPMICNGPHRVTLRSGNRGLLRAGAVGGQAPNGFRELLPYQMSIAWGGQTAESSSDGTADFMIDSAGGRAGDMSLSINVARGGAPLVAGAYGDSIIVQLQAAN